MNLTLLDEMPTVNLGLVIDHNTPQLLGNIVLPVGLSIHGVVDEVFVVSNCQPKIQKLHIYINNIP